MLKVLMISSLLFLSLVPTSGDILAKEADTESY